MGYSVLAFDPATTTGWAWHAEGMPRPFFGAFTLPVDDKNPGKTFAVFEDWLREKFIQCRDAGYPITHFFFEAQHVATHQKKGKDGEFKPSMNMETAERLIGLGKVIEKFAYQVKPKSQRNTWCWKVEIGTWRKHFIGRGSGFKKDARGKYLPNHDPKELAIQRCAEYGWHTDIADAAEAIGILDYALTQIPGYERPWRDAMLLNTMER